MIVLFFFMGDVFLLLCVPGNPQMSDTLHFTVLDAVHFCLPINLLELCSGMQLTYLEIIWSFEVELFVFVFVFFVWIWGGAHSRVNCSPLARQDLEYFTHCPTLQVFLVWPFGTGTVTGLVCVTDTIPPNPFGWTFPWSWLVFLNIHVLICMPLFCSMNFSFIGLCWLFS